MEEEYYESDSRSRSVSPTHPPCDYLKKFIKAYELTPSLWDRTNQHYTNRHKRNKDLDKLARILRYLKPHATRDDARKKVNSLRSNFRKELVKIERSKMSAAEPDAVYRSRSATFHMLKFLAKSEDFVLSQGDSDDCEDKVEITKDFLSFGDEDPLQPTKLIKKAKLVKRRELSTPSPRNAPQSKITSKAPQSNIISTVPQSNIISTVPQSNIILSQPTEQPTVEPIALVWSEKIKNLSPAQRLHVEKAINDILYEAELQNLSELKERARSPVNVSYLSRNSDTNKVNGPELVVEKEEKLN